MDTDKPTGLITRVNNWLAHPFNAQGTALEWIGFVGILAVAAFLWNVVIEEIRSNI